MNKQPDTSLRPDSPQEDPQDEQNTPQSNWWSTSLSRRQANKRIAKIGMTTALLATAGITIGCDEDVVEERDSLAVQKDLGWNAGATEKSLKLSYPSQTDSKGSIDWQAYLDPNKLREAYKPSQSEWDPFVSPTLSMALSQPTLRSQIQPVHSPSMDEAYSRGLGMKQLLMDSEQPESKAIIVDIPGPEAVAYAAALSDVADVVMTFDNWPHPNGVVQTEETLGAMVYYAAEIEENKSKRSADAPVIFLMDSNRLANYTDDGDKFDNRYAVTMPTAENLKERNVESIMYAVPSDQRQSELDDLNADFVDYREKEINVSLIPLTDFKPVTAQTIEEHGAIDGDSTATSNSGRRAYYYGGHPYYSPFFYSYYPMFMPIYAYGAISSMRRAPVSRPSYQPARRQTMFSSRTVGGKGGVGKQKPSGFGRVSTSTNSSGKTTVGNRGSSRSSGRSGSYGRSGGRGSSG